MAELLYHNLSNNNTNMSETTKSTESQTTTCSLDNYSIVMMLGYMLVFCIGTAGNCLVLLFYKKHWKHGPIIELLILYLAFFNLLSSILDPFVFGYWIVTCNKTWHFGAVGCKALPPLCRVSTNISIGIILIMAIDRCRMIVSPMAGHLKRSTIHCCVIATVILGFASEINYVYGLYIKDDGSCGVRDTRYFHAYSYPLVAVVTLRVLTIITILACTTLAASYKLNTTRKSTMLLGSNPQLNKRLTIRYHKVTGMLVVMAIVFAITVTPRDILHLVYTLSWITPGDGILTSTLLNDTNQALKLLQTSNAIYNVFIYAGMYEPFRKMVKSVLFCQQTFISRLTWRTRHVTILHKTESKPGKTSNGKTMTTKYVGKR